MQELMMEGERGKGREGSVRRKEEGRSSKRCRIVEEHVGEEGDTGGGKSARVDREGNRGVEDTSSGSEYMPEGHDLGGMGTSSESLETKAQLSDAGHGSEVREGSRTGRRRRSSTIPNLEVLWRAFKEENMMDSSGSDYEGTNQSGAEDSDQVSLVEESDIGDIVAEGGGEGRSGRRTESTWEKVVRCEARTLRRKTRGDDVLLGGIH